MYARMLTLYIAREKRDKNRFALIHWLLTASARLMKQDGEPFTPADFGLEGEGGSGEGRVPSNEALRTKWQVAWMNFRRGKKAPQ